MCEGLYHEPGRGGAAEVGDGDVAFVFGAGEVLEGGWPGEVVGSECFGVDEDGTFLPGDGGEGRVCGRESFDGEFDRAVHAVFFLRTFEVVGGGGDDVRFGVFAFGHDFASEFGCAEGGEDVLACVSGMVEGFLHGEFGFFIGIGVDDDFLLPAARGEGDERGSGGEDGDEGRFEDVFHVFGCG